MASYPLGASDLYFCTNKFCLGLGEKKIGFGHVRRSKGFLATRMADMISALCICIAGVLQVASIVVFE
jgi:hypothetical protein